MEGQIMPILMLLFIWLIIGLPLTVAKKAAEQQKKNAPQKAQKKPETEQPRKVPAKKPDPAERLTTLTPSISVTGHDDSVYRGSLNAVTGEGYDPCHDEQMAGLDRAKQSSPPPRAAQPQAGLPFGWTGSDMVRGIVMSEILKRKH